MFALGLSLILSAGAQAQAFRTYLSGGGNDGNPCSLVAPCRLLPAAIAAVIDGGEVWMLDSATYNLWLPVNVNKSVTILAVPGALANVLAVVENAIDIATPGVKVTLRNLVIAADVRGAGVFSSGINMTAGLSLTVDKCLIANLPLDGISVSANGASVLVTDTVIRGNGFGGSSGNGLVVSGGARATVTRATISGNRNVGVFVLADLPDTTTTADIADSTVEGNSDGVDSISMMGLAKVSVRNSQVVRNKVGIASNAQFQVGVATTLSVSNNVISNNVIGVLAEDGAKVWASGNTVSDNGTGLQNDSAYFESARDNAVRNNGTDISGAITAIPKL